MSLIYDQQPPKRRLLQSFILWALIIGLVLIFAWSAFHTIAQTASGPGAVISSSQVLVIQSVDGGLIESLQVREGDIVQRRQVVARMERTKLGVSHKKQSPRLTKEEAYPIAKLAKKGDVNRTGVIRSQRAMNDAQAELINRKNTYIRTPAPSWLRSRMISTKTRKSGPNAISNSPPVSFAHRSTVSSRTYGLPLWVGCSAQGTN